MERVLLFKNQLPEPTAGQAAGRGTNTYEREPLVSFWQPMSDTSLWSLQRCSRPLSTPPQLQKEIGKGRGRCYPWSSLLYEEFRVVSVVRCCVPFNGWAHKVGNACKEVGVEFCLPLHIYLESTFDLLLSLLDQE